MTQLDLLNAPQPAPVRCDPRIDPQARPRLSRQCAAILARLQAGPATNRELSEIALKYTNRVSELRVAGYNVICETNHVSGRSEYFLGRRDEA